MKKVIALAVSVSLALTTPAAAQGLGGLGGGSLGSSMVDVLMSLIFGGYGGNQGCNQSIGNSMSSNLRSSLDNSVRRFEASIAPPASTRSLGCLNQLSGINLEQIFSGSGFNLDSILSNLTSGVQNAVAGAMCSFAQQAFSRLTQSLRGGMSGGGFGSMGGMGGGMGGFTPFSGNAVLTQYGPDTATPLNASVQPYGSTGGGQPQTMTPVQPVPSASPSLFNVSPLRSGGGIGVGSGQ